jgi:hypothetical protein
MFLRLKRSPKDERIVLDTYREILAMQFAIMQLSEAKQGSKDEINVCKTRFK